MIPNIYTQLATYSWAALFMVWFVGFLKTKQTAKIEHFDEQIFVLSLLAAGFTLLFSQTLLPGFLGIAFLRSNTFLGSIGVFFAYAGVAFAIWARIELGGNWSGVVVSIKVNHLLVKTGPYNYVRHPIYLGFFAAALGTAMTIGTIGAYFAVLLLLLAFVIRIRREEYVMLAQFSEQYVLYKEKTKMLIPFVL